MGIPWDAMSLPQRLMYIADDSLSSFPNLNPVNMSREHAYLFFDAILASQSKQERFIEFSIAGDALQVHKLQPGGDKGTDEEIIELDDPPKSPSKSHKRSPGKAKTKSPSKPPSQEFVDVSPPFGSITSDTSQRTEFPLATPTTFSTATPPAATLPVADPSKVTGPSLSPPTPATPTTFPAAIPPSPAATLPVANPSKVTAPSSLLAPPTPATPTLTTFSAATPPAATLPVANPSNLKVTAPSLAPSDVPAQLGPKAAALARPEPAPAFSRAGLSQSRHSWLGPSHGFWQRESRRSSLSPDHPDVMVSLFFKKKIL